MRGFIPSLYSALMGPSTGLTRRTFYDAHCVACYNTQMHWREQRRATDWDILKALVQRWQARARLAWSEDDVQEEARHLNDTVYRFPQTSGRVSLLTREAR